MKKMNMKTRITITAICLLASLTLSAQYTISGRVIHEGKHTPLDYSNVVLQTSDSVFVSGTTCNAKGEFRFRNIAPGNYLIKTTYLGYNPSLTVLNGLINSVNLGDIPMVEETSQLETVTVTASAVTNKADRLVVFVTDQQKVGASNGINLLNNLQLPRLIVNPLTNEVSMAGDGKVMFCLNGVPAEHGDIRALQPKEIIRVEYLDNPGLRYGNVDAVINYIIKREVSGGSVSMDLDNSVTTKFGNNQIAAKINYKKSEFGFRYAMTYREPKKVWIDSEQTFRFSDGSVMRRYDEGLPGDITENRHHFTLSYSLLDDKNNFVATVRHSITDDDKISFTRQHNSINPAAVTDVRQGSDTRQQLPSIDLYYARTLPKKQTLIFNLVGTYIHSDINQQYEESGNGELITDIVSDVTGKKYSIIGEGIYEKIFHKAGRFTAGVKHMQAFADNNYLGTVDATTKLDQSDSYLYAEYAGKTGKLNYIGGVGVSRAWSKQKGEDDYTYYTFRPKITLQYDFTRSTFLRLRGEVFNSNPSLSRISAVDQYIDTLQINRGNPALKPNVNYMANLLFSWRKGIYGLQSSSSVIYSPDPIMEDIYRENDKFIFSFDNQKSWRKLNSELTLNVGPVKKILMFSLTGGVNRYLSKGNSYYHNYTNFYYRAQVMARYKRFTGIFQSQSAYDHFSGESLNGGEDIHLFMLSYNAGKFTVGAGMMLPFSDKYEREFENRNMYTPSTMKMYSNDFSRMVLVKFAWNFDFGRKVKEIRKRVDNQDTDPGILQSR